MSTPENIPPLLGRTNCVRVKCSVRPDLSLFVQSSQIDIIGLPLNRKSQ